MIADIRIAFTITADAEVTIEANPGDISADYYGVFADRIQEVLGADRQDPL